ncbi:MAG: hypothetical protein J6S82_10445 [Bacteroidales bacterium]|nr:hypothetical protein [Bacteroidales bacterium]
MENPMDFWRYEWNRTADTTAATSLERLFETEDNSSNLFSGSIINTSDFDVYYKPEKGECDETCLIKPRSFILNIRVDGVATCKYNDKVFKVPGKFFYHPGISILSNGNVAFIDSERIAKLAKEKIGYQYGWMSLNQLDNSWKSLFFFAKKINP